MGKRLELKKWESLSWIEERNQFSDSDQSGEYEKNPIHILMIPPNYMTPF